MKSNVLYGALLGELNKMIHTQGAIVDFLPRAIKAGSHPHLIRYLEMQQREGQSLLRAIDTEKYTDKKSINADVHALMTGCIKMLRDTRMGRGRDLCIKAFASEILAHEIECLSCLVSMTDKLGMDEKDIFLKNLRRREALHKKLVLLDPDFNEQKSVMPVGVERSAQERGGGICRVEAKKNTQINKKEKRRI